MPTGAISLRRRYELGIGAGVLLDVIDSNANNHNNGLYGQLNGAYSCLHHFYKRTIKSLYSSGLSQSKKLGKVVNPFRKTNE